MDIVETLYKGCRFRSRFEARWAVFFDALDIQWEYVPETFELKNGVQITPAFWLPLHKSGYGFWVDTPPTYANCCRQREQHMALLAAESGSHAYLMWGTPSENTCGSFCDYRTGVIRYGRSLSDFVGSFTDPDRIDGAVAAARGARFEFGESGAAE
ncbi:hypothetical protein [Burkholderia gladioli]|uniref:hypothetical protein n=1 Tax=Burkholderia gladioli TaxID=28095 RepID=UPI003EE2A168